MSDDLRPLDSSGSGWEQPDMRAEVTPSTLLGGPAVEVQLGATSVTLTPQEALRLAVALLQTIDRSAQTS